MAFVPDSLTPYRSCPQCHAPLSQLIVGGVGVWQKTIVCRKCQKIQRGVPFRQVIVPLVAEQYGISEESARIADETSQAEYEAILADQEPFDDLPRVTTTARYVLRRRAG